MGHSAEALRNFEEALRIRTAALGPDHPDVASIMTNIGMVLDVRAAVRARARACVRVCKGSG
jgi:hypothetical protein